MIAHVYLGDDENRPYVKVKYKDDVKTFYSLNTFKYILKKWKRISRYFDREKYTNE
jgi:hypothetical protein